MRSLKILLLIAFMAIASSTITAQGFGIRAGANFSDVSGSGLDTSAKAGLFLGVYKEITVVKSLFFVQPELQYTQEGFSTKTGDVKIDYISVPLLAKVYALKVLSFETGPQFGFPISDNQDTLDPEGFVTSWDFGMSINLPLHLSINARYITGITDTFSNLDGKNQSYQIGAAFRF